MSGTFSDNLIFKLGSGNVRRIRETRIGIAGAGGLGSNCAANLVRIGFRKLKIIDFDVVDVSNLDRQFYFADQVGMLKVAALEQNLLRIDADLALEPEAARIDRTNAALLFEGCSIIAECLDNAESKSMLVSTLLPLGKLVVSVSGLGGYGSSDDIRVHTINEKLIVVGDLQSDISSKPALSPRVSIAAAKQADEILACVLG